MFDDRIATGMARVVCIAAVLQCGKQIENYLCITFAG
jgi:hypothetical protein